jgi:hypothetical protein
MEEKILEILKKNCYPLGELDDDEQAAKEINKLTYDHYMRFMKWVHISTDEKISKLYNYWLTNIVKK